MRAHLSIHRHPFTAIAAHIDAYEKASAAVGALWGCGIHLSTTYRAHERESPVSLRLDDGNRLFHQLFKELFHTPA